MTDSQEPPTECGTMGDMTDETLAAMDAGPVRRVPADRLTRTGCVDCSHPGREHHPGGCARAACQCRKAD